ncbi:MAG: host specificity protein, partial [Pseudomonadota bacterium]
LSGLLRGQAGTDGIIPDAWPVGTDFVALNGRAVQPDLPLSARGLERHYRVGPASLAYDAPEYIHLVETVEGVGLRPYAPAQLRAVEEGGDIRLTWIRRTRIDGDVWSAGEVPLGESFERYHVRILRGGALLREREVAASEDVYTAAEQAADAPGPWTVEVAQISERFGPGLYSRIDINA